MAWDGNGSFSRTNGDKTGATAWQQDQSAGVKIRADRHDTHDQDLAGGINNCLTKDGQNTPTADLPMGGRKHTNVSAAAARNQYATLAQVQDGGGQYGGTAGGTADAITISLTPSPGAYAAGQIFSFIANADNTGNVTLNISSIGVKNIKKAGGVGLAAGDIKNGDPVSVIYDGTDFRLIAQPDKVWIDHGHTPTFGSTTTFTVPGDQTSIYAVGTRLKITDASTLYATVTNSAFSSVTTVTVTLDSGDLSASISKVETSAITDKNIPQDLLKSGDIGSTVQAYDADTLKSDETKNLTAGHTSDIHAIGNSGTGTVEIDPRLSKLQTLTVNGSFTLGHLASVGGATLLLVTNDATGGYSISLTGWTVVGQYDNAANKKHVFNAIQFGSEKWLLIAEAS